MSTKYVYAFDEPLPAHINNPKALLGGKGHGLNRMLHLGLPIPPGFTITTEACIKYQEYQTWPQGLAEEVEQAVARLEQKTGKRFGDPNNPLLVSVRSGAMVSMPGMMDTVLNLGLNDEIVEGLAKLTNNRRFAYDSYRRFISMFGDVVKGVKKEHFDAALDARKAAKKAQNDTDLTAEDLVEVVRQFKAVYQEHAREPFPQDHRIQLREAISAVFRSWNNSRAIAYRNMNNLPHTLGTAVNVQSMVFGNMGEDCATGVAFTRDPSTGENVPYGEFLPNAQGEDVVAGIRTPFYLDAMHKTFPECTKQLYEIFKLLENDAKNFQDIEFTIEKNKLYILQTRNAKCTAAAAVRAAVDMVKEGMITPEVAIGRVTPSQLDSLLHKQLDPKAKKAAKVAARGLPASPGAAVGQAVFTAEDAVAAKKEGRRVVLIREETSPEDIAGMAAAEGILTSRGGRTSHAAVVARGMNVCCIAGAGSVHVDAKAKMAKIEGGAAIKEGDWVSLDGTTGEVFLGELPVVDAKVGGELREFLDMCDKLSKLEVHANADTPEDARQARSFGAKGIGLVRTEHMFFETSRILSVRAMIVADTLEERQLALNKLLPLQRNDFIGILREMDGLPVVIRLIDPPLHEFLPNDEKGIKELATQLGRPPQTLIRKIESMRESNPMLGFRGCRLGIVYPEINEMQVRAIFEAALHLIKETNGRARPRPYIEVPLVGDLAEFKAIADIVKKVARMTGADGVVDYKVGTMIEVPRAALLADELAKHAQFFSFGTNDLTQMTCGFSRDDAGAFLSHYTAKKIYAQDPFMSLDRHGVGKLMRLCVVLARSVNPHIEIGICGEHGGDPDSISFCHEIGLNVVSCSPYRVPVARLAAAQAAAKQGSNTLSDTLKRVQDAVSGIFLSSSQL